MDTHTQDQAFLGQGYILITLHEDISGLLKKKKYIKYKTIILMSNFLYLRFQPNLVFSVFTGWFYAIIIPGQII